MRSISSTLFLGVVGCLCFAIGCGSGTPPQTEAEPLSYVLTAYLEATHTLTRPPQDETELRKFLAEGEQKLISPRDGLPYVIRWGVSVHDPNLDPANPPIIAYEQQGKNGVRQAINVMGMTELTDEQFANLPQ